MPSLISINYKKYRAKSPPPPRNVHQKFFGSYGTGLTQTFERQIKIKTIIIDIPRESSTNQG